VRLNGSLSDLSCQETLTNSADRAWCSTGDIARRCTFWREYSIRSVRHKPTLTEKFREFFGGENVGRSFGRITGKALLINNVLGCLFGQKTVKRINR
jgi:hypothetical protein